MNSILQFNVRVYFTTTTPTEMVICKFFDNFALDSVTWLSARQYMLV